MILITLTTNKVIGSKVKVTEDIFQKIWSKTAEAYDRLFAVEYAADNENSFTDKF